MRIKSLYFLILFILPTFLFSQLNPFIPNIAVNDLLYLKSTDRLFASTSNLTAQGNRLHKVNPNTYEIESSYVMVQGPGTLVPSADEKYIYVAATGTPMVRRFNVALDAFDLNITPSLGVSTNLTATAVAPMPGNPEVVAVLWSNPLGGSPTYIALYEGNKRRTQFLYNNDPISTTQSFYFDIDFGLDSSLLYVVGTDPITYTPCIGKYQIDTSGTLYTGATKIFGATYALRSLEFDKRNQRYYSNDGKAYEVSSADSSLQLEASFLDVTQSFSSITDISIHPDSNYMIIVSGNPMKFDLSTYVRLPLSNMATWPYPTAISAFGHNNNLAFNTNGITFYTDCVLPIDPPNLIADKTTFCLNNLTDVPTIRADPGYFKYYWSNRTVTKDSIRTVQYSDQINQYFAIDQSGCLTPLSKHLNFNATWPPQAPMVMYDKTTFCNGDSAKLFVWDVSNVFWSNGALGQYIYVTESGNYSCYTESAPGCQSPMSNIVAINKINATPLPQPIISVVEAPPHCINDTLHIITNYPIGNVWTTPISSTNDTLIIQAFGAMLITVTAQDSLGCLSEPAQLLIESGGGQSYQPYFVAPFLQTTTRPGAVYHWYLDQIEVAVTDIPFYLPTSVGWYSVGIEENGCLSAPFLFTYVGTVSSDSIDANLPLTISPNPVSHSLFVSRLNPNEPALFTCYNLNGSAIFEHKELTPNGVLAIDVESIPSGVYQLQCIQEKQVRSVSFIKL